MLAELESNRLEVVLTPCKRETNVCGCIRVAASRNAEWYRKFCAKHPSSRRRKNAAPDTRIKRMDTVRLLERMIRSRHLAPSKYAQELVALADALVPNPF